MKRITLVTAKILERYADLIARGVKRYEVRSESLDGVDAIHLVSAETGDDLGIYEVLRTLRFSRDEDSEVMSLAQTTREQFYELFPLPDADGPRTLWAAELGARTTSDALIAPENVGLR